MNDTRLPVEVELAYEVMTCQAARVAQEPISRPHPCNYFRSWGSYHSYDYDFEGPPSEGAVERIVNYVGRAPLVPELLSGCRKAPIMAVGINPNLPGWWRRHRRSVYPLFDDFRQYAHYFRYRGTEKLELGEEDFERFGGLESDSPYADKELSVPMDKDGRRWISVQPQPQGMYVSYQGLLDGLAASMGWSDGRLIVGEDLSYGNMVASASAKWTTKQSSSDEDGPAMTPAERDGIVQECFRTRRYFLRQLFQSLPRVVLVFSQSTANAFIGEFESRFTSGNPHVGDTVDSLIEREVRLEYGTLADGTPLDARVIFAPHITGDPERFHAVRERVVEQLVEEARRGTISFNEATGHLSRSRGACAFCPMLEIGACDYVADLEPISLQARLTADSPLLSHFDERRAQGELLGDLGRASPERAQAWALSDEDGDSQ